MNNNDRFPFKLHSPAFTDNTLIPKDYTCDGTNKKIPLIWENPPKGTKTYAIVMEDPDTYAGTFTHWLVWNIDVNVTGIIDDMINYQIGQNSAKKKDYTGPCPPRKGGSIHRYFFTIYALDTTLDTSKYKIVTIKELEKEMYSHILGRATLMGKYGKQ